MQVKITLDKNQHNQSTHMLARRWVRVLAEFESQVQCEARYWQFDQGNRNYLGVEIPDRYQHLFRLWIAGSELAGLCEELTDLGSTAQ